MNLLVVFGGVADGVEHAAVGVSESDAASGHYASGDVEKFCHGYIAETGGAAFAE